MPTIFARHALLPEGWTADVAVEIGADGRIAAVTPGARDPGGPPRALLPAPSNLHSHTFQRAMAGRTERRGPEADSFWTWRALMYRFLEALDPDDVEAIAALAFVEMQEAGFAAAAEFHYLHHGPGGVPYADPAELSARICAAAAETGIGLTLLPVLYAFGGADGRPLAGGQLRFGCDLNGFERLHEGAARHLAGLPGDARMGVAPHSLRAVGPEMLAGVAAAHPVGPVHIHAAEQPAEVREVVARLGARPVEWLLDQGVDARWCLIHATHMTPEETAGLARSGAVAGLCPVTEGNLGDGVFDGARFLAAGGVFGIGTDSNVRIDLREELRLLEYGQRLRDGARNALLAAPGSSGALLWAGALEGGCRALGREAGAIRVGALADLVGLDAEHLALAGIGPDMWLDSLVFGPSDGAIRDVWSAGRHSVCDGRHVARERVEARYRTRMGRLAALL
ncbi:formimidoylglutamate deiminase [Amaricoccus sp.]|uniref:formimidoylglutamate deiminase n=1 Tax=Amaricoccus sp. TaxID=1872485 RepID=UPI001B4AAE8D|nr:formimidoylglutamate deiminase [Amaricoccus sp.]MBP7000087.1 formimidoylglutamate deiminase [Amaricoccus sp.]